MDPRETRPVIDEHVKKLLEPYEQMGLETFAYRPADGTAEFSRAYCAAHDVKPLWTGVPACFNNVVHPDDRPLCAELFRAIDAGEPHSTQVLRTPDLAGCIRFTLRPAEFDEKGRVTLAVGIAEDLSHGLEDARVAQQVEALLAARDPKARDAAAIRNRVALAVGGLFYGIYHVDLRRNAFVCYRTELPGIEARLGREGDFTKGWATYIETYVDPEDREALYAFSDIGTLPDRLMHADVIAHEYRRTGIGWTLGQFICAARDNDGIPTHAVYAVTDVNVEHDREALADRALYAASHDALTGVLNRAAYDDLLASHALAGQAAGFVVLDIDNFKDLNDEHGHEFGDRAIATVARELVVTFRDYDQVFRLGGDEFAVLLHGCDASCWSALCRKVSRIHAGLRDKIPDSALTLSAGVCFGADGLEGWMYEAADKALYNTKRNGRAGCTLVSPDGTVLMTWRDSDSSDVSTVALVNSNAGTARLEITLDGSRPSRLVCGEAFRAVYGFPPTVTPERAHDLWVAGIDPAYLPTLYQAADEMARGGTVESTFVWNHPTSGPFLVRVIGSGKVEDGVVSIYGVHRSLRGAKVVEREDDTKLMLAAQNALNFCSVYVNVPDRTYRAYRLGGQPIVEQVPQGAADAFASNFERFVDPAYRDVVAEFLDFATIDERLGDQLCIDCEYLSTTGVGWCRARWLPVRRDEEGRLTYALFLIESIDAAKQAQIERDREADRLMQIHYLASESVSDARIDGISLIDRETGEAESWRVGETGLVPIPLGYGELKTKTANYVYPGERTSFLNATALSSVFSALGEKGVYTVPARAAKDGRDWYFEYRYTAYAPDPRYVLEVVQDVTAVREEAGRSVADLFEAVPGGIMTLEWDGEGFKILNISKRYEEVFGASISTDEDGSRRPSFGRAHPDDREALMAAVAEMLETGEELTHTCRFWNEVTGAYVWTQVNAIPSPQPNGHALVYVNYTDVSALMEARYELARTEASLKAALGASSQLSYEYDPVLHVGTCYTDENFFGLPKRIEGYPESLRDYDIFHPEDLDLFLASVREMDQGARHAQCDVRIRKNQGAYRWYSCLFNTRFDEELGRDLVTLLVIDVTLRVQASRVVSERADMLLGATGGLLAVTNFNLSRNVVTDMRLPGIDASIVPWPQSYDEAVAGVAAGMLDASTRKDYFDHFSREALLSLASKGQASTRLESLYRVGDGRTQWIEVAAELVPNPATGEIEGVGYSRDVTPVRLGRMLLNAGFEADYPMAAVLVNGGDEYYAYNTIRGSICEHHVDFWSRYAADLATVCGEEETRRVTEGVTRERILAALAAGETPELAFNVQTAERMARYVLRFSMIDASKGLVLTALRNVVDEAMFEQLRHEARHDRVTGIYNRFGLFERCRELLDAHPETPYSMVRLDIRRFRLFNAFFGEEAGDELLRTIAAGIDTFCGNLGNVAFGRVEGDVFGILAPASPELFARGEDMVERFVTYSDTFLIEPSVGIYGIVDRTMSIESMLARATTAARSGSGTGLVHRYDEEMDRRLDEEMDVIRDMQHALDDGQFQVFLQPKFDFRTGRVASAEALARWLHPDRGVIMPGVFIPVFEGNGFITKLDRFMWEESCRLLRDWGEKGLEPRPISVNVSRVSACNPQTVPFLKDLVARYGIDPALLELELTESAYIDDPEGIKRQLADLREHGFRILMDDFGAGYSSLNTLRELPVDMIKLDRMFLTEAMAEDRGRIVVSSIVEMAERLGLPVVAEGVETSEQADYLRSVGCEYVQGFLYARPMPVGDFESLAWT